MVVARYRGVFEGVSAGYARQVEFLDRRREVTTNRWTHVAFVLLAFGTPRSLCRPPRGDRFGGR